jgi:prophage tail gpP-like protein
MADDITVQVQTCTKVANPVKGKPTYNRSNPRTITGWENIRLTRGIERCPSDFEMSMSEPYPNVTDIMINPGDYIEINLGADHVFTGFVDRVTPSISASEHTVRIQGRSLCQDIVDCGGNWFGLQLRNMTVDQIAQYLCDFYGIVVNVAPGTDVGSPIPLLNPMVGETIYSILERICRFRALLLYDMPDGSLRLASGGQSSSNGTTSTSSPIGATHAASGFKEGINVQEATVALSMDGRYSDYDGVYLGLDTLRDTGGASNQIAHAVDPNVPRFRYKATICESVIGGKEIATMRVNWEMTRRHGRSYQVRLTTDSWRDSAGTLYSPNSLVDIDLPSLKLPLTSWLISELTYKRDASTGTTCELTIMPPESFYQEPIVLNPVAPDTQVTT